MVGDPVGGQSGTPVPRHTERKCVVQNEIPRQMRHVFGRPFRLAVVVLVLSSLVHPTLGGAGAVAGGRRGEAAALPRPVAEMRERLLSAVAAGRIEDLREPLEWNELPFMSRDGDRDGGTDPIAYWRSLSPDGEGRAVLEAIGRSLALSPARLALGRDVENSAVYVWPYLAEQPLDRLTADEDADLRSLMPAEDAGRLKTQGRWTWWRLVIGADGTWHALTRLP